MKEKEIRGNPFRNALNQIRVKFTKSRHFLKSSSLTTLQLGPNVTRFVGSRRLLHFVGTSRAIRWNFLATASHHRTRLASWVELCCRRNITAFGAQFITYWGGSLVTSRTSHLWQPISQHYSYGCLVYRQQPPCQRPHPACQSVTLEPLFKFCWVSITASNAGNLIFAIQRLEENR